MMERDEIEAIASGWIHHMSSGGSPVQSKGAWAFDVLYDLCFELPEDAWLITEAILSRELTPHLKLLVAGGPIEGLLAQHGEQFIERVEERARKDVEFKALLGGVWKNRMKEDIWHRLQAVAGPPI